MGRREDRSWVGALPKDLSLGRGPGGGRWSSSAAGVGGSPLPLASPLCRLKEGSEPRGSLVDKEGKEGIQVVGASSSRSGDREWAFDKHHLPLGPT